jgi:hypothetical protein
MAWRYDQGQNRFFSKPGQKFSREALVEHLCVLSRQYGRIILQQTVLLEGNVPWGINVTILPPG